MNRVKAFLIASLATMSFAAHAAPGPENLRPYLGLGLSFVPQDHDERHADYGAGVYGGGGVPLNKYFAVEGDMFYDRWNRDSSPNDNRWHEYGAEAAGLLTLPIGHGWIPFLSAGVGVVQSRLSGDGRSVDMNYALGSGIFYLFGAYGRDWGLRLDARYRITDLGDSVFGHGGIDNINEDKIGEAVVRFGMVTLLGHRPEAPAAPVKAPPAPVVSDSDGDGVPDSIDECPATPAGVKVNPKGCPESVELGSPANALAHYGPIYFGFDQSALRPAERAKVDTALKEIRGMKNPKIIIKLDGHTDSKGTPDYNQALGERRANVVKQYMLSKGVKANSIELNSYGESKPAADNATDAGRALNRRVEILVVED